MRTRSIIIILLLLFASCSGFLGTATATNINNLTVVTRVAWNTPNSTLPAVPGENDIPLYVTFIYKAPASEAQVLNISINLSATPHSPFSYSYIIGPDKKVRNYYNIEAPEPGAEYTIMQLVNISTTATTGIYQEKLSYVLYNYSTHTVIYGNSSFYLPLMGVVNITVMSAFFGTESTPMVGTPGMRDVPISILLTNTGNAPVTSITVNYVPAHSLYGNAQTTTIPAMGPYSVITLTFIVSIKNDTMLGFVHQNLTVSYNGKMQTVPFTVPILGYSKISVITYFTDPPIIFEGEKFIKLTVFTVNTGNAFAKNVSVYITSKYFNSITPAYYIPIYAPGTMLNFTFYINAKNFVGRAPVYFHIGHSSKLIMLHLYNSGNISISSIVPKLNPGSSKILLIFNIKNTGNITLRYLQIHLLAPDIVSIHIPSSNPLAALTANNITFSELTPRQSIKVTFVIDVSSAAISGYYPAQLLVMWHLNNTYNIFSKTYNFGIVISPYTVQSVFSGWTPADIAILVVIVGVVIAIIIIAMSKKKSKRK